MNPWYMIGWLVLAGIIVYVVLLIFGAHPSW